MALTGSGVSLWGCAAAKNVLTGAQGPWGMLGTWQQTLHTSTGLDLERGFERGREGQKEQQIVVMRIGETARLDEELLSHSLWAPLAGTGLVA